MTARTARQSPDPDVDDIADIVLRLQSEGSASGRSPRVAWGRRPVRRRDALGRRPARSPSTPTRTRIASVTVRAAQRRCRALAIYEDGRRVAPARTQSRPRYYDLTTADGVPYWKIALLHLDSLASTVLQTCAYWGNERPVHLLRHRRVAGGRPHDRQEDAGASWPRWRWRHATSTARSTSR